MTMAGRYSEIGWCVVVSAKSLASAKTRLRSLGRVRTAELVAAMFEDTMVALSESRRVDQIVVVTDDEILSATAEFYGARTVPDPDRGLNGAFVAGTAALVKDWSVVAYLPGDLPCLTGSIMDDTLRVAEQCEAAMVPDADGVGSAMLTHRVDWQGRPRFGADSLQHHLELGARPLWASHPAARRDVDVASDLVEAMRIGVGRYTAAVCARLSERVSA
jgi:2-phospho-L-lactate guanylyltransferase